jgi:hypothetical protein
LDKRCHGMAPRDGGPRRPSHALHRDGGPLRHSNAMPRYATARHGAAWLGGGKATEGNAPRRQGEAGLGDAWAKQSTATVPLGIARLRQCGD